METPYQQQIDIRDIVFAECNPKLHDLGTLVESIKTFGFTEIPLINSTTMRLVAGEGRVRALRLLAESGAAPPLGVTVVGKNWLIDARFFPFPTDALAQAYLFESNLSVLAGSDQLAFDYIKLFEEDKFLSEMKALAEQDALPPSFDGDTLDDVCAIVQMQAETPAEDNKHFIACPKCGYNFKSSEPKKKRKGEIGLGKNKDSTANRQPE